MLFDVRSSTVGDWTVVRVVGDVDLASLPALRGELDRAGRSAEPAVGNVALDLGAVAYVDPVALGVVLAARVRAVRRGARVAVVCPAGPARDLLAEAGVDLAVDVVDAVDELS